MTSRLWFACTLVSAAWLAFGLQTVGIPVACSSASIEVRSVPSGAEVLVEGKPAGMTDSFLSVPSGRVEIRVKKQGYRDASASIDVKEGKTPLVAFELEPQDGKLKVKSQEEGDFQVWLGPVQPRKLDGKDAELAPGVYEVWGVRQGLSSLRKTVRIRSGATQEVALAWDKAAQEEWRAPVSEPTPRSAQVGLPNSVGEKPRPAVIQAPAWRPALPPSAQAPVVPARPSWQPPRVAVPNRPSLPPARVPRAVWTPIPSEPSHSAPSHSAPGPMFTPLP